MYPRPPPRSDRSQEIRAHGCRFCAELDTALEGPLLEREPAARELLEREPSLDRRLDVELLGDVGLLTDQFARAARKLLACGLRRLPQVDRAPPIGRLVRDPGLEPQARNVGERIHRLVAQIPPELRDRRLRVREVPEEEAKEQELAGRPRELCDHPLDQTK